MIGKKLGHFRIEAKLGSGGMGGWAAASVGIAQAVAAPKKTISISPRKGEVSKKARSGCRDDGLSGPGEDCSEPPERRTVLEGLSWRPKGVSSGVPEGQKTNSGFNFQEEMFVTSGG